MNERVNGISYLDEVQVLCLTGAPKIPKTKSQPSKTVFLIL